MDTLPPPPGFRGLDPSLPITRYVRHLPHWRQEGATYFVTFNLGDALPQAKLKELKALRQAWENENPRPRSEAAWEDLARRITRKAERWMDNGYGVCHFRRPAFSRLLHDAILFFQGERYDVFCFSVMPNHCHATVRPYKGFRLEKVVGSWKDHVAKRVNKPSIRRGASGSKRATTESFETRSIFNGASSTSGRILGGRESRDRSGSDGCILSGRTVGGVLRMNERQQKLKDDGLKAHPTTVERLDARDVGWPFWPSSGDSKTTG